VRGNADGSSAKGHRQQFGMVNVLRRHMSDFTRKTEQSKQRRDGDSCGNVSGIPNLACISFMLIRGACDCTA